MRLRLGICLCLLIGAFPLGAQRIDTELIVVSGGGAVVAKTFGKAAPTVTAIATDIYLLRFAHPEDASRSLQRLHKASPPTVAQYNYRVEPRSVPDDPQYFRQSNLRRAGFETAWERTTGGVSPGGDTIVVAVLDSGFDPSHEDLAANIWTSGGEIPGDGRDNDGNGYVDDLHGWNFADDESSHPADPHGTAVAGILGARGDNGIGVAGSNWSVRLMPFTIATVADIIAAYQYVIEQRERYNASNGREGAFVVATNASFGIEEATCEDFPAWGGMYDRLGAVGILTAASVANVSRDVDVSGDMPVDCPSAFLLGVTNVDENDRLFSSAGYGREHVDLAAPGEGSYTTRPGNAYASFGSTSAAAPYLTGAIALLYATPACERFGALVRTEPAAAALRVREALLGSVVSAPSLAGKTSTGGLLDVAGAQERFAVSCGDDEQGSVLVAAYPNPTADVIYLQLGREVPAGELTLSITDVLGRTVGLAEAEPVGSLGDRLRVRTGSLPVGVYYLSVSARGWRESIKFVKH